MYDFLGGAMMMGFLMVSVFFTRFWVRTRDRLFAIFAVSFLILSAERWFLLLVEEANEARSMVYLMRLVSFSLIIWGVVDKNRVHVKKPRIEKGPPPSSLGDGRDLSAHH